MNAAQTRKVREELLADPARIDAAAAALRVYNAHSGCSEGMSRYHIDTLRAEMEIGRLFRRLLPEKFKGRRARHSEGLLRARDYDALLGFPISGDWYVDVAAETLRIGEAVEMLGIPIYSLNNSAQLSFEELRLVFQVADLISPRHEYGEMGAGDWLTYWRRFRESHRLPEALRPDGDVSLKTVHDFYLAERGPLRHMPLIHRVLHYDTGCALFDFDDEWGYEQIEWSRESILWLGREYEEAKKIIKAVNSLGDWLEADPQTRVAQALRVYQSAVRFSDGTRKRKPKPRAARPARALVEIL